MFDAEHPNDPEARLTFDVGSPQRRVPVVQANARVRDVVRVLVGQRYDSAAHVVACQGEKFVGLARIEDVLASDPSTILGNIIDADPPLISETTDEEVAAWKAVRHGESALAIVDDAGRFVGVIPPRMMVEVLLTEHDEDLARLGGYLASTSSVRHATEEAIPRRLWHRLPWLLIGLAGAVAAAALVGNFQRQLEANVLLTFFVPGIVYMADAVGTQTEALVIRGLSVGVPIGRILRRELVTGISVGVILALAFLPAGLSLWHDREVAMAVAIALVGACSTATVVAMALPALLARFGQDPAFGSGPLATVIQDLLSLLIYLTVASAIVG